MNDFIDTCIALIIFGVVVLVIVAIILIVVQIGTILF